MSGYVPTLAEFSIAFLLHSISLVRILLIFHYKRKARKEIAPFMMSLLLNWTLVCALIIPYESLGMAVWRPVQALPHNGQLLFFIALPAHISLAMIPVSVFFLTLDRILIIRFAYNYGQRAKKALMYGYVCSLLLSFVVCMSGFLSALPVPFQTQCEIFGCILGQSVEVYLAWRAFCSFFNFSSGILFFVHLYKSGKKLAIQQQQGVAGTDNNKLWKKQQSKNNKMTVLAIVNEFFLAFLPHFGPFIWERIYGPGSSMATGPLSEFSSSFEVLIFASVYSHVLKSSAQNSSVLSGPSQQVASRANPPQSRAPSSRQMFQNVGQRSPKAAKSHPVISIQ